MTFSQSEQYSIHYLVQELIRADRLVLLEENVCWNTVSLKMGWGIVDADTFAHMTMADAIDILAQMDKDKKRFAAAFFVMIILADQHVAPEEVSLLKTITEQAQLPHIPTADCPDTLEQYVK